MLADLLWIVAGLVILTVGADRMVAGAVRLSLRFGISPLIIGLTVVSSGTSAPELFVSLQASFRGSGDIAMGNIVGSNIFNLTMILGLSALLQPIKVRSQLIRQDIPVMIAVTILFYVITRNLAMARWEGGMLFLILIAYLALMVHLARRGNDPDLTEEFQHHIPGQAQGSMLMDFVWVAAGIGMLMLGARWLVGGAVNIASQLGVSEAIIGLTIVAAGTSLPELATSAVAAAKKESDIAVGNVVGSNIFNILCIGGLAPLIHPFSFPDVEQTDFLAMLILSVILLPVAFAGRNLGRLEGLFFLACYGGYLYIIWP